MTNISVNDGLTIEQILTLGEDQSMYSCLTSNAINVTANSVSNVIALVDQLKQTNDSTKQNDLINQITQLITNETITLNQLIQNDLNAQQVVSNGRDISEALNVSSSLNFNSPLLNIIATSTLRKIANSAVS